MWEGKKWVDGGSLLGVQSVANRGVVKRVSRCSLCLGQVSTRSWQDLDVVGPSRDADNQLRTLIQEEGYHGPHWSDEPNWHDGGS